MVGKIRKYSFSDLITPGCITFIATISNLVYMPPQWDLEYREDDLSFHPTQIEFERLILRTLWNFQIVLLMPF